MRLYIGFDIGDAESIIELSTSVGDSVQPATMPGKAAAGQAIPTLYAFDMDGNGVLADQVASDYENLKQVEMNFKRRPGDLLSLRPERVNELLSIDARQLLKEPEFRSGSIREFAEKICVFVNIVLKDENFLERVRAFAVDCEDCVICVGHPTNWDALDCHIYKAILLKSVMGEERYLGLPLSLALECESRAAFLYIKNTYSVKLAEGEFVGLMDVGSSTIDISVLTKSSKNCIYDSGSNFLGARSIDYLILEYYIEEIEKKSPQEKVQLMDVLSNNDAAFRSLLLNCRLAKETLFSSSTKNKSGLKVRIYFGDFIPVLLSWDTLVSDICSKRAIAPVLVKYCALPEGNARELGSQSWISAFRNFLQAQIHTMRKNGIELTKLFLTGSASRMEFVRTICKELLPQLKDMDSLFDDTNPSNAIANGLARVGASEYKADIFMVDMEAFFNKDRGDMYTTIRHRIPDLIQDIADPIAGIVQEDIILPALYRWQKGEYKTLRDMMDDVEATCKDEKKFNDILAKNRAFSDAVGSWMVNKVGHDIAVSLQGIAQKHRVYDFSIDQLNAFKELQVKVGNSAVKTNGVSVITQIPADEIAYAIAAVVGVVSYLVIPYVTGFIIGVVWLFFESIAIEILAFLMANPLLALAGFAAIALLLAASVVTGYKKNKEKINRWLLEQNFPKAVRKGINISKIAAQMKNERAEMVNTISMEMNKEETVDKLGKGIYSNIFSQVSKRADQIRYEIESR